MEDLKFDVQLVADTMSYLLSKHYGQDVTVKFTPKMPEAPDK